jgi:hypothetical protein
MGKKEYPQTGGMIIYKLMISINENICVGVYRNNVGVPGRKFSV